MAKKNDENPETVKTQEEKKPEAGTRDAAKKNSGIDDVKDDQGLKTLTFIMGMGLLAILIISIFTAGLSGKENSFWPVAGLSLSFSLAASIIGGFLGFLFGIPRSLQRAAGDVNASGTTAAKEKPYANNTNLEQISDWLTKIIVGVSLTQLPSIEKRFDQLCTSLASGFEGYLKEPFAYPYSGSLVIFFAVCGFLFVYLWAKIYLLKQLSKIEKEIEDTWNEKIKKEIINVVNTTQDKKREEIVSAVNTLQDKKREISDLQKKIDEFGRTKTRMTALESDPEIKKILDVARPGPISVDDDCQKNRWGGQSSDGAYSASATFEKEDPEDPKCENFNVEIKVTTNDPEKSPITGFVYFFLHETFYQSSILKVTPKNNQASATITGTYEAFTIGFVLNEGAVKLELDLNLLENTPDTYKYSDKLFTIDELKKNLEELKKDES